MVDLFLHAKEGDINNSFLEDEFTLFLQEIEICLKTLPYDLWGIRDSIDLNRYVFNHYVTEIEIKTNIENHIIENCYHNKFFNFNVTPYFEEYEQRTMLRIEFKIAPVDTKENEERIQYINFILG